MIPEPAPAASPETSLGDVLAELLEALEQGLAPDRHLWTRRYPHFATELDDFLQSREQLEPWTAPLRSAARALAATLPPGKPVTLGRGADAPAAARDTPLPSLGEYALLAEIGRGGMGLVYKARQKSLNRLVALKVIRASALASAEDLRRFRNEAGVVAQLDHPHIAPVYEVGERDGVQFFSMKLIEGGSLAKYLDRFLSDPRAAARLLVTVARAVHHAHERGVLHRDLKPSNILLDAQGEPHVSDFGLAKRVEADSSLTQSGALVGTPSYMAPEQASGVRGALTPATDVYGLGAVLYALLCGRPPFHGATVLETLDQVRSCEPESPSGRNPGIDRDLQTICLKCLEKKPEHRYSSAAALAQDLERWLEGRPIQARPSGAVDRLRRWCRRNPVLATAFLVLVLALTGLTAATGLLWNEKQQTHAALEQANQLRTQADEERQHALEQAALARRYLYPADMRLAHQAWQNADVRSLHSLLARHIPEAGQEDLRGFEWHYLWRLAHPGPRPLRGHSGEVNHVAFSRDGHWLASSGQDGTVRLWNAATGQPVRTFAGHTQDVNWVSFAPDGATLASASDDQTVRLWDVASGRQRTAWQAHTGEVVAAEFAPDGSVLASAGQDGRVKLWDPAAGRLLATLEGHHSRVEALAFTPDSQTLVSAEHNQVVLVWDLASVRQSPLPPSRPRTALTADSQLLGIAVAPDGKTLAAACMDSCAQVWDLASGRKRAEFKHPDRLDSVAFSPDGQTLATGCRDGGVRLFDLATGEIGTALGHTAKVWSVAFSPTGNQLASASADHTVQLWRPERLPPRRLLHRGRDRIRGLQFAPDRRALLLEGDGGRAGLLDVRTGQARRDFGSSSPNAPPGAIAGSADAGFCRRPGVFTPDARTLFLLGPRGTVEIWEAPGGCFLGGLPGSPGGMMCLALSADSQTLAIGPDGWSIWLWNTATRKPVRRLQVKQTETPVCLRDLAFSPDGQTLAAGWPGMLTAWDVPTGRVRFHIKGLDDLLCLAYAPDGRSIVTGSVNGPQVRDTQSGDLKAPLLGHKPGTAIHSLALSPDGRTLATSGNDHTIRLWNTGTWQELFVLGEFAGWPGPVAFAPDGTTLAAAIRERQESKIYLWSMAK